MYKLSTNSYVCLDRFKDDTQENPGWTLKLTGFERCIGSHRSLKQEKIEEINRPPIFLLSMSSPDDTNDAFEEDWTVWPYPWPPKDFKYDIKELVKSITSNPDEKQESECRLVRNWDYGWERIELDLEDTTDEEEHD